MQPVSKTAYAHTTALSAHTEKRQKTEFTNNACWGQKKKRREEKKKTWRRSNHESSYKEVTLVCVIQRVHIRFCVLMVSLKGQHHRKTKHFHDRLFKLNEVWSKAVCNRKLSMQFRIFRKKGKNCRHFKDSFYNFKDSPNYLWSNISQIGIPNQVWTWWPFKIAFLDEHKWSQDGHHIFWSFLFVSTKNNDFNKPQRGFSLNFFRKKIIINRWNKKQ